MSGLGCKPSLGPMGDTLKPHALLIPETTDGDRNSWGSRQTDWSLMLERCLESGKMDGKPEKPEEEQCQEEVWEPVGGRVPDAEDERESRKGGHPTVQPGAASYTQRDPEGEAHVDMQGLVTADICLAEQ